MSRYKTTNRRDKLEGLNKDTGVRPVDKHVGNRVRIKRALMGMPQVLLGDKLSIRFKQIKKYERGANRIGASRLF